MPAYGNALAINADSSDQQLGLAIDILLTARGVVILDNAVALRATATGLVCEVIDPAPTSRLCEHEFEVLVENAQRVLESSRLSKRLPKIPRKWLVVEDNGTKIVQWWPAR